MRIVFVSQGATLDVEARFEHPDAQVSDLAIALGAKPARDGRMPGLFVDGLHQPGELEIEDSGLHEGATVSFTLAGDADAAHVAPRDGELAVLLLSGMAAGRAVPIVAEGEYLVGRLPECHVQLPDLTVSRVHCTLRVTTIGGATVVNRSDSVGTRIDGVMIDNPQLVPFGAPVLLGAVVIAVDRLSAGDRIGGFDRVRRLGPSGTVSFNRPPRVVTAEHEVILDPPVEPEAAGKAPFNVASLVAPLVLGLVMVLALHNVLYAMFALLSPVMVVGNWWEAKHRSSRALRGSTRAYARELAEFDETVADAHALAADQRRSALPSLPEVLLRARLPSVRLWERRTGHDDFLVLILGFADDDWRPKLTGERRRAPSGEAAAILARRRTVFDIPVVADLKDGGVVGIVGPRPEALALARSLLCQAAVLHGPADLRIAVLAADDPELVWDWAKWLPHTRDQSGGTERRLVAAGEQNTSELLASLLSDARPNAASMADEGRRTT